MKILVHYHHKPSEKFDSTPLDDPCARDKIRSLLRQKGCHLLKFIDETDKVVLTLKGSD